MRTGQGKTYSRYWLRERKRQPLFSRKRTPGFPATEDALKTRAYMLLAAAINQSSLEQKHIQPKKVDESNEKFAFRVWLVRLGLNGADSKAERKTFYGNLTGHTAFRTKEDEEKWYARPGQRPLQ